MLEPNKLNWKNLSKQYDEALLSNNTEVIEMLELLVAKFAPECPL